MKHTEVFLKAKLINKNKQTKALFPAFCWMLGKKNPGISSSSDAGNHSIFRERFVALCNFVAHHNPQSAEHHFPISKKQVNIQT